eukprot:s1830_g18.t1
MKLNGNEDTTFYSWKWDSRLIFLVLSDASPTSLSLISCTRLGDLQVQLGAGIPLRTSGAMKTGAPQVVYRSGPLIPISCGILNAAGRC